MESESRVNLRDVLFYHFRISQKPGFCKLFVWLRSRLKLPNQLLARREPRGVLGMNRGIR